MNLVQKMMLIFILLAGMLYSIDGSIKKEEEPNLSEMVICDIQPKVLKQINPKYGEKEKKAGKQGIIWIKAEVETDGLVGNVKMVSNNTGSKKLVKNSIDAIKQWKFKPGIKDGKPIKCWIKVPFKFSLE